MKPLGLAVLCLFFFIDSLNAQDKGRFSLDKFFVKAGYEHTYRSASSYVSKNVTSKRGTILNPEAWVNAFYAGVGYEFNNIFHLEVEYRYVNEISDGISERWKITLENTYYRYYASSYKTHELILRGNIFVNNDRRDDPVYFTSGIVFSVQPVRDLLIEEDEDRTEITKHSYNRVMTGPMAGVGIFWDFGDVCVQTEAIIGSKFSISRKDASEIMFAVNISPVFKL